MEELSLKELFEIFWSRKTYMVIIIIACTIVGYIYTYMFTTPEYKSETSLLLVKQNETTVSSSETLTTTDLTLNQKLVSTYSELIKSKAILKTVIDNLKLDVTEEDLKPTITVSSAKDTELIKIAVVNKDPKQAMLIANEIVPVFTDMVKKTYKIDNVNVIDKAEIEETPYNINHLKDLIIFAFIGVIISVAYILIANMLDTTVKNKEKIEEKLGLSVLVEIPLCNFNEKAMNKKRGGKR